MKWNAILLCWYLLTYCSICHTLSHSSRLLSNIVNNKANAYIIIMAILYKYYLSSIYSKIAKNAEDVSELLSTFDGNNEHVSNKFSFSFIFMCCRTDFISWLLMLLYFVQLDLVLFVAIFSNCKKSIALFFYIQNDSFFGNTLVHCAINSIKCRKKHKQHEIEMKEKHSEWSEKNDFDSFPGHLLFFILMLPKNVALPIYLYL